MTQNISAFYKILPDEIEQCNLMPVHSALLSKYNKMCWFAKKTYGRFTYKKLCSVAARIRAIQEERVRLGTAWSNPNSFFWY